MTIMQASECSKFYNKLFDKLNRKFEELESTINGEYANEQRLLWMANSMLAYSYDKLFMYNQDIDNHIKELVDGYAKRMGSELTLDIIGW